MKNKWIILIICIILVVIGFIVFKKPSKRTLNLSELKHYNIKFDEYEEYGDLRLLCYEDNDENKCDLYDKSISTNKPIETITSPSDEYTPNYIHFGNFDYEEKIAFKTNDSLVKSIDFINNFYSVYTKNNNTYNRTIKVRGKSAQEYKTTKEYIIYKEENNSNYFIVPLKDVSHLSSFVINDTNAVCIYTREDKKYVYPKIVIYNYKNGEIVKEYNFDKLKNIYSYEDSPYGFNEYEKLFMLYDKNYYLNLDNLKELVLKNANMEFDRLIINNNKVYDYQLNLIREFNSDETPIFIPIEKEEYLTANILYKKNNTIYDLNNKEIYKLNTNEKYYSTNNVLVIYNDKYISKVIDINGDVLLDNTDNKYDIDKSLKELDVDLNGNIIKYFDNDIISIKNYKNNKEIDYNYRIDNIYIKENINGHNAKVTLYDKDLNVINSFDYNNEEEIYRIDYSMLNNNILRVALCIMNNDDYKYSINYLYDLNNNKLKEESIYYRDDINIIELDDNVIILGGSKNNTSEYLYLVNDNIKINNDLNIKSVYSYSNGDIIFEVDDLNYIVIPINELDKIK